MTIAASCQKLGGKVLYLDFEQSVTPAYAKQMGCNLDDDTMMIVQPLNIDIAWDLVAQVSEVGVNLIVLDSIAGMFPEVEEKDARDLKGQIGYQAKGLSQFFPRIKAQAREKNFAVLAINQVRAKLAFGFGANIQRSPAYTMELPGGWAPKFYTDLMYYLAIKKTEKTEGATLEGEKSEVYTGSHITVSVWKNKVGMPHRKGQMYINFGQGIDDFRSVVEQATGLGIIDLRRNGVWSIKSEGDFDGIAVDEPILSGRGAETIDTELTANPRVFDYIRKRVLSRDFITEVMDSQEAADVNQLLTADFTGAPPEFVPPPASAPPPIPTEFQAPVKAKKEKGDK
jgi:RecA/RadA recombinase